VFMPCALSFLSTRTVADGLWGDSEFATKRRCNLHCYALSLSKKNCRRRALWDCEFVTSAIAAKKMKKSFQNDPSRESLESDREGQKRLV
jgi:hypothetical protein